MNVSALTYYRVRLRQKQRAWNRMVYRFIVFAELEEPLERLVARINRIVIRRPHAPR